MQMHHTRKVFVGGLPTNANAAMLNDYFGTFGPVEEAVIIHDKQTRMPRGFGFVTFVDGNAAERAVSMHYHEFMGKMVWAARHGHRWHARPS